MRHFAKFYRDDVEGGDGVSFSFSWNTYVSQFPVFLFNESMSLMSLSDPEEDEDDFRNFSLIVGWFWLTNVSILKYTVELSGASPWFWDHLVFFRLLWKKFTNALALWRIMSEKKCKFSYWGTEVPMKLWKIVKNGPKLDKIEKWTTYYPIELSFPEPKNRNRFTDPTLILICTM